MALVEEFLRSVKPPLAYELSALQDGYGPAITDRLLQAIIVSEETRKGGDACNAKRAIAEPPMEPLVVVCMPLVDEGHAESDAPIAEANKASSTDKRKALLAQLRGGDEHWCRRSPAGAPYVIGLTGASRPARAPRGRCASRLRPRSRRPRAST